MFVISFPVLPPTLVPPPNLPCNYLNPILVTFPHSRYGCHHRYLNLILLCRHHKESRVLVTFSHSRYVCSCLMIFFLATCFCRKMYIVWFSYATLKISLKSSLPSQLLKKWKEVLLFGMSTNVTTIVITWCIVDELWANRWSFVNPALVVEDPIVFWLGVPFTIPLVHVKILLWYLVSEVMYCCFEVQCTLGSCCAAYGHLNKIVNLNVYMYMYIYWIVHFVINKL